MDDLDVRIRGAVFFSFITVSFVRSVRPFQTE